MVAPRTPSGPSASESISLSRPAASTPRPAQLTLLQRGPAGTGPEKVPFQRRIAGVFSARRRDAAYKMCEIRVGQGGVFTYGALRVTVHDRVTRQHRYALRPWRILGKRVPPQCSGA